MIPKFKFWYPTSKFSPTKVHFYIFETHLFFWVVKNRKSKHPLIFFSFAPSFIALIPHHSVNIIKDANFNQLHSVNKLFSSDTCHTHILHHSFSRIKGNMYLVEQSIGYVHTPKLWIRITKPLHESSLMYNLAYMYSTHETQILA